MQQKGHSAAIDFHSSRKESPATVYNGASFAAEIRRDDADRRQSSQFTTHILTALNTQPTSALI
jgi:hypothetical protein